MYFKLGEPWSDAHNVQTWQIVGFVFLPYNAYPGQQTDLWICCPALRGRFKMPHAQVYNCLNNFFSTYLNPSNLNKIKQFPIAEIMWIVMVAQSRNSVRGVHQKQYVPQFLKHFQKIAED